MSPFERWTLWLSLASCAISGAVYGWMKYLLRTDDPYAIVNHSWQPFFLKLHIATAPLLVFALGLVFSRHIWARYRAGGGRGRRTGIVMLATWVPMAATGYALQILAEPSWLRALGVGHLVLGGMWTFGFLFHRVATRRASEQGVAQHEERAEGVNEPGRLTGTTG